MLGGFAPALHGGQLLTAFSGGLPDESAPSADQPHARIGLRPWLPGGMLGSGARSLGNVEMNGNELPADSFAALSLGYDRHRLLIVIRGSLSAPDGGTNIAPRTLLQHSPPAPNHRKRIWDARGRSS